MASYAYTFTSGDTITPTKLNNARTVSDIVNADVSATAAIAGTKISPNFGSQNIATTGQVSAGGNFVTQVTGFGGLSMTCNATSGVNEIISRRSRGTAASPTVVQSGDNLLTIAGQGYDGSTYRNAAFITCAVGGVPGDSDMPGLITFSTTADGASTPTERMRITSSGFVGVNEAAPQAGVHASGQDQQPIVRLTNTTASTGKTFEVISGNAGAFRIQDVTAAAERMRIDASGNVLIGTTAAINVTAGSTDGVSLEPGGVVVASKNQNPAAFFRRRGTNGDLIQCFRDTTQVGSISVTTTATAFNTSSDYRLKQNVEPMVGGLAKLAALSPKTFEFKSEPSVKVDGFIAHEVQAVVPIAVTGEKDGTEMQGMDNSKLVPVLVAAVQELAAKVAVLEAA